MNERPCSIIIINDRVSVRPEKMIDSIKTQNDFRLIGVAKTIEQVREIVSGERVDIIIFAGYQKNENNYSVVEMLSTLEHKPIAVMWALPDSFINSVCNEYKIFFKFDRQQPLADFFDYLRIIMNNNQK